MLLSSLMLNVTYIVIIELIFHNVMLLSSSHLLNKGYMGTFVIGLYLY